MPKSVEIHLLCEFMPSKPSSVPVFNAIFLPLGLNIMSIRVNFAGFFRDLINCLIFVHTGVNLFTRGASTFLATAKNSN